MDSVIAEYKKERIALQKKYEALKAPFWEQRAKIVSGETFVEGSEARKCLFFHKTITANYLIFAFLNIF